jgi:hypothetical protein
MPSGIIKGSLTSCCFLGSRKRVGVGLCNVARGWAGSCIFTIKKPRELAGKSRTMPVRLAAELRLRNDDYDCWQTHERVTADLRLCDRSTKR